MKKLKTLAIAGAAVLASLLGGASTYAVTCPTGSLRTEADTYAGCNMPAEAEDTDLMETVQTIINVIVAVVGIVAVAVIVIGGVFYVISTGEPPKTKRAKDTILYGVVGLVIAVLAYAIVNFVLINVFNGGSGGGGGGDDGDDSGDGVTYVVTSEIA